MSSPALSRRVYRFGIFQVDPGKRQLLRRGSPVRLQEQPFRILCMLVETPGQAVTREELRQALWPSDTYVEFDGSLNAALKRLRFALADSARNPVFIETIPKHGYRFIAPVAVEDPDHPPDPAPASRNGQVIVGPAPPVTRRRHWPYFAIPLGAAVILHQIVYWLFPLPPPRMVNRTRLTHIGNAEPGRIVSDGARIFFLARRGGRRFPMQTSISGGDAVEVKTPFDNSMIFDISPDRTNFLLGSQDRIANGYKLWIWPVQGGAPQPYGDPPCSGAGWSPDGGRIAFVGGRKLRVANSDGSAPRIVADKPGYNPVWSPDGHRIRFSDWDPLVGLHSLWEVGADGSHLHQIFPGNERVNDTAGGFWLAGGKYCAFLQGSFPHHQLWMTREWSSFWRRSSPRPFYVSIGAEDTETIVGLGQNSSRLISVGYWPNNKLYRLDGDSHSLATVSLFPTAANLHFPPDGKWVAYVSTAEPSVWRCQADGKDCLQLTPASLGALEPRWSPDGNQILFVGSGPHDIRRLYLVAAQGSAPPKALSPPALVAGIADWSPDGRQLILSMSAASPQALEHLYLIDTATGKSAVLPGSEGYHDPAWSHGGRIAAVNSASDRIFAYNPQRKEWAPGPAGIHLGYLYWSSRVDELFYQDLGAPDQPIYRFNPVTGRTQLSFSYRDILQKDAQAVRFSGIGPDDSLYPYVLAATSDLFAVDLDLP